MHSKEFVALSNSKISLSTFDLAARSRGAEDGSTVSPRRLFEAGKELPNFTERLPEARSQQKIRAREGLQKLREDFFGAQEHFAGPARRNRRGLSAGPFFILAAAAIGTLLRRQHRSRSLQLKVRHFLEMVESSRSTRIDAHLHVWASPQEAEQFPYNPDHKPNVPANAEFLVEYMDRAGVDGALIVQPINHGFDHSYVSSVIQRYPGRFVGCLLANPAPDGAGVKEMERLVTEEGYKAVRFNPYLWPEGEKMTNGVGKALFKRAGELGAPVGFMCFKGLMLHVEEIEELCAEFPDTRVLMDHFGFCKPPTNDEEQAAWRRLLSLSRFPQMHVKASAFFRVSREGFPYKDVRSMLRELVDEFGPARILWGSDFPFVVNECGYINAWHILDGEEGEEEVLSPLERSLIFGGSALSLFPGGWEREAAAHFNVTDPEVDEEVKAELQLQK